MTSFNYKTFTEKFAGGLAQISQDMADMLESFVSMNPHKSTKELLTIAKANPALSQKIANSGCTDVQLARFLEQMRREQAIAEKYSQVSSPAFMEKKAGEADPKHTDMAISEQSHPRDTPKVLVEKELDDEYRFDVDVVTTEALLDQKRIGDENKTIEAQLDTKKSGLVKFRNEDAFKGDIHITDRQRKEDKNITPKPADSAVKTKQSDEFLHTKSPDGLKVAGVGFDNFDMDEDGMEGNDPRPFDELDEGLAFDIKGGEEGPEKPEAGGVEKEQDIDAMLKEFGVDLPEDTGYEAAYPHFKERIVEDASTGTPLRVHVIKFNPSNPELMDLMGNEEGKIDDNEIADAAMNYVAFMHPDLVIDADSLDLSNIEKGEIRVIVSPSEDAKAAEYFKAKRKERADKAKDSPVVEEEAQTDETDEPGDEEEGDEEDNNDNDNEEGEEEEEGEPTEPSEPSEPAIVDNPEDNEVSEVPAVPAIAEEPTPATPIPEPEVSPMPVVEPESTPVMDTVPVEEPIVNVMNEPVSVSVKSMGQPIEIEEEARPTKKPRFNPATGKFELF